MNKLSAILLTAAVLGMGASSARADATIVSKINDMTQTIQTAPHKISVSSPDGGLIFRGDLDLVWMVNPNEKTYTEMTEADMKAMADRISKAMQQFNQMKDKMPPEMLERAKKMMPAELPTDRTVKPMGIDKEINGFPCTGYTVTSSDGTTSDVWTTDPKSIKLRPEDLEAFKELADFMTAMLPGMNSMADWAKDFSNPKEGEVPGVPVLSITKDSSGKETLRTELVKVDHGSVPGSAFDAPAGFEKKPMRMMSNQ